MTKIVVRNDYVAPRVADTSANGRVTRRAKCGHDVYLSARGVEAVDGEGKPLICSQCMEALAREHGARWAVWSIE